MKESNKAYIIAQSLLWGIQEGKTSESELKTINKLCKKGFRIL